MRLLYWLVLLWCPFLFPSIIILFLFILQPKFIDDFLIFCEDACIYFLLSISIAALVKGLTASGGRLVWFVGVLELGMTRGVISKGVKS